MDQFSSLRTKDGRVLPDDIRCISCSAYIRGGPQEMMRRRDEIARAFAPNRVVRWLVPIILVALTLASLWMLFDSAASATEVSSSSAWISGVLAALAVAGVVWTGYRFRYNDGKILTLAGFAVGVGFAPLVMLIVAIGNSL